MYTMNVTANIDKLYFTVRQDVDVQLGYWDADFGETVKSGIVKLKAGELYEMNQQEDGVYSYVSPEGGNLYSPLYTFLKDSNYVIFPSKEVIEDFIAKVVNR